MAHSHQRGVFREMVTDICVQNLINDHTSNDEAHSGSEGENETD